MPQKLHAHALIVRLWRWLRPEPPAALPPRPITGLDRLPRCV
jgi:hypothetical protein